MNDQRPNSNELSYLWKSTTTNQQDSIINSKESSKDQNKLRSLSLE
jgi:hypothetical protein